MTNHDCCYRLWSWRILSVPALYLSSRNYPIRTRTTPIWSRLVIWHPIGETESSIFSPPPFVTCVCRRAGFPFSLRVSGNKHGAGDGGQNLRADGEYSAVLWKSFSAMFWRLSSLWIHISGYKDSLVEHNQLVGRDRLSWGGKEGWGAREKWLARLTGRALLYIAGSLGGFHISPPWYNSWDVSIQCQQLFSVVVDDIYWASGGGGGREAAAASWWVRVSSTLAGDLSFTAAPLRHSLLPIIW